MWIMLSDSFVSIVVTPDTPRDHLLVRARSKGDIEKVFGDVKVTKTPKSDYLFRAYIPKVTVAETISAAISGINYDNFKNTVVDDDRHDAYLRCWVAMHDFQKERATKKRKRRVVKKEEHDAAWWNTPYYVR
jgi:hypothetical protein